MAVFTKNIKLEFLSAADKIEKWAEPINDNLIKIDALGTEIVAAMLPFASLREAIEKNAGTNVDSTQIFFPDNMSLPDVADGVKRKLTDVIAQIANNKMSVNDPTVASGSMTLLSGTQSIPALKFGNVYDVYVQNGNLVFAKGNTTAMTLVDKGIQVPETNEFEPTQVVNVSFLKSKGLQAQWAGAGLKYTGAPTQYLEVIGNKLKAIQVDPTNGVEMTWDDLVKTSVIKLSDYMVIQDPVTKEFKVSTKQEFLGQLLTKNYSAKYDPTTNSVIGDPLNSTLNPAGPSVPDGESAGNVEYTIQKNGSFDGKPVYAGQTIYWDVGSSSWKLKAEYVRLTSFTGADGNTIVGDMLAGYGQYTASLIKLDTGTMESVQPASTSVQAAIKDLDSKKFNKTGGTITGDVTVDNITVTTGNTVTIETAPVNDFDAINKIYADAKFALLLGDKLNVFRVATPVGDDDAIPKKYVENLVAGTVSAYYTKTESDNKFALKAGNLSQAFQVATPSADEHAVNKKFVVDGFAKKQGDSTLVFESANPIGEFDVVNKKYLEENVISGQSAGSGLKFTAGATGVPPKLDVELVAKMGLGFDTTDENGKLMLDYPALDRTQSVRPGDYIMIYDDVAGEIKKVKKDDFLGTLTQSLRLRGSWNPVTNVIIGDPLNPQLISGQVTIDSFQKTLPYAKGAFVYYAPVQPLWVEANAYVKGDRVTKDDVDYVANDDIPANTAFVQGTSGATWQFINLYETYRANVAVAAGPFDASKWTKVSYGGAGPIGLPGDNMSGFSYSVTVDGSYDLNADGNTVAMLAGDQIVWTGTAWVLVPDAQAVKSVFGRTGPVTAAVGDYKSEQITYTRATGKTDISGSTSDVLVALNDLDDKKVSTTKDQTITGNKTFSGSTTFQTAPKVPSKPLTPADDDLITQAYVSKLLTDREYITRVYNTAVGKPINWNMAQQQISLTASTLNAGAESEINIDAISKLTIKGNSYIGTEDNSRITLGSASTLDTDANLIHFKGKYDLRSTASMDASGKINIKYTPTDDDDAVPKKWVEDKIAVQLALSYTKVQQDAKYYLKTGGAVSGWGSFKATASEQFGLKVLSEDGTGELKFLCNSNTNGGMYSGDGTPIVRNLFGNIMVGDQAASINMEGFSTFKLGAAIYPGKMISTIGTLSAPGDTRLAIADKLIGGKMHAGLWGHNIFPDSTKTSSDLDEANSFLLNSDMWELKGKRFNISTVEGAHCSVVPTEDTHLVNKKFLDGKLILDSGPADGKNYVRKNGAWSELVIAAPSYWTLPDLPQRLKDLVKDASQDNDNNYSRVYNGMVFFPSVSNGTIFQANDGTRATWGSTVLNAEYYPGSGVTLSTQSKNLTIMSEKGLNLSNKGTDEFAITQMASDIVLEISQPGDRDIVINRNSGDFVGTKNTVIHMKGGKGGTDKRQLVLKAIDPNSVGLQISPGQTIFDSSVGKQLQFIPDEKIADAFYYDTINTRWNFRKLPRMATDTLNVAPTQPEEFITKKHLDSVTGSLGVAAGVEGQVYTMGATSWAGKFPQYMGAVKESSAINKIKIDDDTAGGKILIQATSVGASDANTGKNIEMFIDGNGQETQFTSNNISIWNESKFGNITLNTQGTSQDMFLSGANTITQQANQIRLYNNSTSLPVMIRQNAVQFGQTLSTESVRIDYSTNTVTGLSQITHKLTFDGTSTNGNLWKQLGSTACHWDELRVVGISSVDGGINITSTASADWSNAATPEQTRRSNRSGPIWITIKKLPYDNASAGTSNAVNLMTETIFGSVNASALGANGTINLQAGPLDFGAIIHSTPVNWNQQIKFASGGTFQFRSAGQFNVQVNNGLALLAGTGASSHNGFSISKTLDAAQCYNGVVPTSGGNIFIRPNAHGGYGGNNVQIGAPSAAGNRFAGLFVRGLDVGEGGSLTVDGAAVNRGIALVGATPTWVGTQAATASDNYPRGGILLGIRGNGAETIADARNIQIINGSKNAKIDIIAQPNASGVNDSAINILQGQGTAGTVDGIKINASKRVELHSELDNVGIYAKLASSKFFVTVAGASSPQIEVTGTTTTIRNLALANVQATDIGNTGSIAPFNATVDGGSFAGQYSRKGAFNSTTTTTGSAFSPHSTAFYTHNGGWGGVYSWGVLNTNAASSGGWCLSHINSAGGEANTLTWSGSNGNLYSASMTTAGLACSGEVNALSFVAGTNGFRSSGTVAINNNSPTLLMQDTDHKSALLHVNSDLCYILRSAAANGTTWDSGPNGRNPMTLSLNTGDVTFSGNITAYSDARLKKEVRDLGYGLDEILKLRPVSFKRIGEDTDRTEMGFIAQEVREVMPEIVIEAQDEEKTLTMTYDKMVAPLVKAIQEQQVMIEKLMKKIEILEGGV